MARELGFWTVFGVRAHRVLVGHAAVRLGDFDADGARGHLHRRQILMAEIGVRVGHHLVDQLLDDRGVFRGEELVGHRGFPFAPSSAVAQTVRKSSA
jgi:hypothetical protein